jgi:hypothetical protein
MEKVNMTITIDDKLQCVVRELGYRYRTYPRKVAKRKMSQSEADHELRVMESIVQDYRRSAQICTPELPIDDAA